MKIAKKKDLAYKTIFVDGFWGSGKSLLFGLINDQKIFPRIIADQTIEDCFQLNNIGKIEKDTLRFIIENRRDLHIFNNKVGRHLNIRISDDTGPENIYDFFKSIIKSFKKYKSNELEKEIIKSNESIPIMLHCCVNSSPVMAEIWQDKLRYLHVCRHPLEVYEHTFNYVNNLFSSALSYELKLETNQKNINGRNLPSFINKSIEQFSNKSNLNALEISLICIADYTKNTCLKYIEKCDNKLFINFENLIVDPEGCLNYIIFDFLNIKSKSKTRINYKKYNLPRDISNSKELNQILFNKIKNKLIDKDIFSFFEESIEMFEETFMCKSF